MSSPLTTRTRRPSTPRWSHDSSSPRTAAKNRLITVTDDIGTEYFESGGGGGGGVKVSHASLGFAPAPPPNARVLRIITDGATVELPLRG